MSANGELACEILQSLGIAVLKRVGAGKYEFFGRAPRFYLDLFSDSSGAPTSTPWENSPMLEFFLEDAERFFDQGESGALTSGVWQEDGKTTDESALIAIAATYGDTQTLIIRMLQEDYNERVSIVRKARTQLLENRKLSHTLKHFKEKSRFDGLTGIFNKSTFMDLLRSAIERYRTQLEPLSLLLLDIDDFKKINDGYGHLAGDAVLQAVGALLAKSLRRCDIVARFGGEEFMILIPGEHENEVRTIAEKVRQNIAALRFEKIPSVTVSIGCTAYRPRESADAFIERADAALYDAKASGKNKICVRRYTQKKLSPSQAETRD